MDEISIIARDSAVLRSRAVDALRAAGCRFREVNAARPTGRHVLLCTIDNAIGLEFRAVIIIGCEEHLPAPVFGSDPQGIEQARSQERRKLYVACTRARERLITTGAGPLTQILPKRKTLTP